MAARYGFVATPTALSGSKPNTGAAQAYVGSLKSITTVAKADTGTTEPTTCASQP